MLNRWTALADALPGCTVWFSVCFLSLVRVFVAVRSLEMAATIATSGRSTSRRRAAKTLRTSPQPGCPARWTFSLPTMTACSARMSACAPPCPSTPTRWSSRHLSTRALTMETGRTARGCLEKKRWMRAAWFIPLFPPAVPNKNLFHNGHCSTEKSNEIASDHQGNITPSK